MENKPEKCTANEIQNKTESLTTAVLSVPKQEWPKWLKINQICLH